ncbi:MAG: substrate-binding domain-containing protein [Chloroflexi bacterium]|nr:substrate-binding domain-containing protein [Chloroflexota bacterium]
MTPTVERSVFLLLTLWLAACSAPPTATIPPSPQPVSVSFSPSLEPARDALHACANTLPEIALFIEKVPAAGQNFKTNDLIIWWGEKPGDMNYAFPLVEDELVVIINPENPNTELSTRELNALFNGRVENWSDISIYDQPVSVWIYPPDSKLSDAFGTAILGTQRFSRLAYLAPTPQAMLEAVAGDPGGIGYVPRSWLTSEVASSLIDPNLQITLRKPLLALVNSEPQGNLRALLNCLQTGVGQERLLDHYSPTS